MDKGFPYENGSLLHLVRKQGVVRAIRRSREKGDTQ